MYKTLLTSLKYWLYVYVCSCVSCIMYHEGADIFGHNPKYSNQRLNRSQYIF